MLTLPKNFETFNEARHRQKSFMSLDGVIEVVLHDCHTFAVEAFNTMKILQENLALPYLRLDTDFSQSDKGQIETRLGAFIEMMEVA